MFGFSTLWLTSSTYIMHSQYVQIYIYSRIIDTQIRDLTAKAWSTAAKNGKIQISSPKGHGENWSVANIIVTCKSPHMLYTHHTFSTGTNQLKSNQTGSWALNWKMIGYRTSRHICKHGIHAIHICIYWTIALYPNDHHPLPATYAIQRSYTRYVFAWFANMLSMWTEFRKHILHLAFP